MLPALATFLSPIRSSVQESVDHRYSGSGSNADKLSWLGQGDIAVEPDVGVAAAVDSVVDAGGAGAGAVVEDVGAVHDDATRSVAKSSWFSIIFGMRS